jgi:hypothetical protein
VNVVTGTKLAKKSSPIKDGQIIVDRVRDGQIGRCSLMLKGT